MLWHNLLVILWNNLQEMSNTEVVQCKTNRWPASQTGMRIDKHNWTFRSMSLTRSKKHTITQAHTTNDANKLSTLPAQNVIKPGIQVNLVLLDVGIQIIRPQHFGYPNQLKKQYTITNIRHENSSGSKKKKKKKKKGWAPLTTIAPISSSPLWCNSWAQ